jgi:predicted acylesterase/phospholipase RssA
MNRVLTERLLRFFRSAQDPIGCATYDFDPSADHGEAPITKRVLQVHGAARFIALCHRPEGQPIFESYERPALFDALAASNPSLQPFVEDIKSRMKFYLFSLNLMLLVITVSALFALSRMKQIPQVTVAAADPQSAVDLHALVFDRTASRDHVILLAASGGGTRAALYTASVLHGLAELNELDNLVLASGVSGGATALAYFGAHHQELKSRDPRAWKKYYDALSQPFIQEVLEGATEWRINQGHRLGCLLAESFSRHLRLTNATIGQSADFGLIFNTALAGHLCDDSGSQRDFEEWANDHRRLTRSDLAGGRLIFTNLRDKECFPRLDVPGSFRMKYVVVQSSNVSLASAAALSANFPPVFSNAAVDKDQTNRFWVTDGGAADNRGIDALLFALRGALREQKTCTNSHRVPMIHIIVADASAATIDYQQDRGMARNLAPRKSSPLNSWKNLSSRSTTCARS